MVPTCERVVERLYVWVRPRVLYAFWNSRSASARTPIHASIVWRAMALGGLVGLVGQKL